MEYTYLKVEYAYQDKIVRITLNRPEARNALNTQMIDELTAAFTSLSSDERLHGVVLTGAGETFCAGADLQMMRDAASLSEEENMADALKLADMLYAIDTFPCPVIARVNGDAYGGGVGLISACDIALAMESARFSFSEVKLGIAPAIISPYVIRKIGETNARVLFVTGERFSAKRARDIGLLHSILPHVHVDDGVLKAVNELLTSAPQALRACKTLALNVGLLGLKEGRQYTAETIARLRVSEEGQEGLKAFLEKRQPRWLNS